MKLKLILFSLCSISLNSFCQSIEGIWFNAEQKTFTEFRNDSCVLTNEFFYYKKNDTTSKYIPVEFGFKVEGDNLEIIEKYLTLGILF